MKTLLVILVLIGQIAGLILCISSNNVEEQSRNIPVGDLGFAYCGGQGFSWGESGLISIEEHNKNILPIVTAKECITNIACPNCKNPLWKDLTIVLTSSPAQYRVYCKKCNYIGTIF